MMSFSTKQKAIVAGGALIVIAAAIWIFSNLRPSKQALTVTLSVWGTDDRSVFDSVIQGYAAVNPNAQIAYEQFDRDTYEEKLLNALAAGAGPDIFMIGNRELPRQIDKIAPADLTKLSIAQFREFFPTVVEQDFVSGGQIYALPLYIDTLALLYNKNLFDQAALVAPPKNWNEFRDIIPRLRVLNAEGGLIRAAAAIGGSEKTVDAGVDLLNLLMLENGAEMTDPEFRSATFARDAGALAFAFYLQFANPGSPYYTWNDARENSLDSFASGKTAMILNYKRALSSIKLKSPFLAVGVALAPRSLGRDDVISYARYDGLAVSKQSKAIPAAWDFIAYLTIGEGASKAYLAGTGEPPALRSLIAKQADDPDFGVFARQALTARSWRQADDVKIRAIFNDAISRSLKGETDPGFALSEAENQVNVLMRK